MSAERGISPLDPRAGTHATRKVDPLMFCPRCGSNDRVIGGGPSDYVTFTADGGKPEEIARAAACGRCKIMWTERTPLGRELRADIAGGKKARSISVPGMPVRPVSDERTDPTRVTMGAHEDPTVVALRQRMKEDIAEYAACQLERHILCRCREIEERMLTIGATKRTH